MRYTLELLFIRFWGPEQIFVCSWCRLHRLETLEKLRDLEAPTYSKSRMISESALPLTNMVSADFTIVKSIISFFFPSHHLLAHSMFFLALAGCGPEKALFIRKSSLIQPP